ncbi:MAG TPA: serine/threonine-protein kinase [Kofleriaceae bacterium]
MIDHARLTELFTEAMDLDAAGQRALIARVRADDTEMANELAEMLDADDEIVTALRTAGLTPHDVGSRRRTAVPIDQVDIPGYAIRSTLGEGGMGTVYGAVDAATQQPVAIKVLQVFADEALARFKQEATIMEKLHHPGIARVLSAGDARSRPYIVMEHVEGATLDKYIERVDPPRSARLALFAEMPPGRSVCDAIEYAHRAGVVHRDLKPANIMVRPDGDVTILDFGVARSAGSSRTQVGDILGTPLYTSPEQAMGRNNEVDARTDIYSLGVILYELIAGQPPYALKGLNLPAAVSMICKAQPPTLADAIDPIAQRALAKKPADRFASAAELAAAVRAIS